MENKTVLWGFDVNGFYAGAGARARDIEQVDANVEREHDRGGPHPQGTHTEGRTPQRTHHRRGGTHRGPTQNTHRQFCSPITGHHIRSLRRDDKQARACAAGG